MTAPVETRGGAGWFETIRSIVTLSWDPLGIRERVRDYRARVRAFDPENRPEGWSGHWSARYGRIFSRTLERYPPFDRSEREMLDSVPRPMNEALDPVASSAEPTDREGRRLPWTPAGSMTYDLLGWPGIAIGAVLLSVVAFSMAVRVSNLPSLTPPAQQQLLPPSPADDKASSNSPLQRPNPADQTVPPNLPAQRINPADEKLPPNLPAQRTSPAGGKAPPNLPRAD
jgi:hypothetical protein